jgi:coenzyme F420-reducing hydrogenase beta subunit
MKSPVIRDIVENNLCIGCGLCAFICPPSTLEMEWNRFGEYNPVEKISCDKECGLCLKVCPFADGNDNEDSIGKALFGDIPQICHRPETGYYLDCYVGYAPDTRERGSSGGMATWLLSTLLKKGIVDYVIAVVPNDDPDQLFKFAILTDPESVLNSSRSVYYPVELSGVLRDIQNKSGKCAIIGVPCFIKAIRLAAQKNRKLKERIHITLGLVCGQQKCKQYTTYLSAHSNVMGPLKKVYYRGKSPDRPASNYNFYCKNENGNEGTITFQEGMGEAWLNRWFTINACNYCDDIFSECADITFMDAWLPEYWSDPRGTNFIIVRTPRLQQILEEAKVSNKISIKKIPINEIIRSQIDVINMKRSFLAVRLFYFFIGRKPIINKRIFPKMMVNPLQVLRQKLIVNMQKKSKIVFIECNSNNTFNIKKFKDIFNKDLINFYRLDKMIRVSRNPKGIIKKIWNKIRG